jgi:hypothetical protein
MGDPNQVTYLKKYMPEIDGSVLEIGSKDYGNTSTFRDFYPGNPYTGVDLEDGPNVDEVIDLTKSTGSLPYDSYSLAICCSVLEHVKRPWLMAENITKLVRPLGFAYISVPWVWRYHPYPDDYYRFSPSGIMELFPEFDWFQIHYSTKFKDDYIEITEKSSKFDDRMAVNVVTTNGKCKYLPYTMVNMIGRKRAAQKISSAA